MQLLMLITAISYFLVFCICLHLLSSFLYLAFSLQTTFVLSVQHASIKRLWSMRRVYVCHNKTSEIFLCAFSSSIFFLHIQNNSFKDPLVFIHEFATLPFDEEIYLLITHISQFVFNFPFLQFEPCKLRKILYCPVSSTVFVFKVLMLSISS